VSEAQLAYLKVQMIILLKSLKIPEGTRDVDTLVKTCKEANKRVAVINKLFEEIDNG
jgi:hypothetical protein